MIRIIIFIFCSTLLFLVESSDNGLARTPYMGWGSRSKYGCNINQEIIRQNANRVVELGLAKKGYVYISVDDCWQISRSSSSGEIIQDSTRFSNGISNLSNYIHSKGLKFGLSSDAGYKTCQGRPGSYGYQKSDANTYAKWEVDYLKYENCNFPQNTTAKLRYYAMSKALNQSGRPILYSIYNSGQQKVWQWAGILANSWRTDEDVTDSWSSFLQVLENQVGLQKYSQIGGWNDPGVLQVGNGNMKLNQYYAQFALWCALKAPLIIGSDLNSISPETLQILGNQQLIAINQNSLGIQARRIKSEVGSTFKRQVWGGPLSNNRYALIFFNRGEKQTQIQISLAKQLGIEFSSYSQRDPIRHASISVSNKQTISINVATHSVQARILTISKSQNLFSQ